MGTIILILFFTVVIIIGWALIARYMLMHSADLGAISIFVTLFVFAIVCGLFRLINDNHEEYVIARYNEHLVTNHIVAYSTNVQTGKADVVPIEKK